MKKNKSTYEKIGEFVFWMVVVLMIGIDLGAGIALGMRMLNNLL